MASTASSKQHIPGQIDFHSTNEWKGAIDNRINSMSTTFRQFLTENAGLLNTFPIGKFYLNAGLIKSIRKWFGNCIARPLGRERSHLYGEGLRFGPLALNG